MEWAHEDSKGMEVSSAEGYDSLLLDAFKAACEFASFLRPAPPLFLAS